MKSVSYAASPRTKTARSALTSMMKIQLFGRSEMVSHLHGLEVVGVHSPPSSIAADPVHELDAVGEKSRESSGEGGGREEEGDSAL